jgi:mono/diheme cytochrome c family protein
MLRQSLIALLLGSFSTLAAIAAEPARDASRGELLYAKHCITCHTAEVHWRDKRIATNWPGLQAQVRRWQKASGLGWSAQDIDAVARYLNTRHYHYPISSE